MSRLIDADEMIDKYGEWYTEEGTDEGFIGTLKGVVNMMPTIEPKRGKWIDTGGKEEWYAREYRCSECGETMLGEANFCPNCGADMRGDQDDEVGS